MSSFLLVGSFKMASTLSIMGSLMTGDATLPAGEEASEYTDWEYGDWTLLVWILPAGDAARGKVECGGDCSVAAACGENAWEYGGDITEDSELPPPILLFNFWKSIIFSSNEACDFLGSCPDDPSDIVVAGAIFKQRFKVWEFNYLVGVL